MKYIYVGKIVNTHGLKGEVRILSDFKYKNLIFKKDFKIYIGNEKSCEVINSYRYHKIFDMITIKGIDNINDVLKYKGKKVFVNKEDIILGTNQYLDEDLINLNVMIDNKIVGKVKKIERYSKNELLVVKSPNKDYFLPYNFDLIENIDLNNKTITYKNIRGMIE